MNELARRYAQALYDLAPDEKALRAAAGALMGDGALWEALCSPAIQPWEKEKVLARLPLWEGQKALQGFFRLLAQKGRMSLLPDILEAFHQMWNLRCAPTRPCWAASPWKLRACDMTRASGGRWPAWPGNWKRGEWHEKSTGRDRLHPAGGD